MVALVGYTNAGKSTLFNALTEAGVLESARMFATLDPKLRQLQLPSRRKILLSDTVGFIRNLPPILVGRASVPPSKRSSEPKFSSTSRTPPALCAKSKMAPQEKHGK